MKNTIFIFAIAMALSLVSCSSPEKDGANIANKINQCRISYLEETQNAEAAFIAGFNGVGYHTRAEAKQAYFDIMGEAYSRYQEALAIIYEQAAEMSTKYVSDYRKKSEYENALNTGIDQDLENRIRLLSVGSEIPEPILTKVRTIIPPKPDIGKIQEDLVGHSLAEGVEDGYYPSSWRWIIKDGEISGFRIENVLSDTPQEYLLVANMRLTSEVGRMYNAKVKIRYVLPQNDDWTIEFVQSMGMHVVNTNLYGECIKIEKGDWDSYRVVNQCDLTLEVGGRYYRYNGWEKFTRVVGPHGEEGLGYPKEVIVDFIERPN